jgi:hypothetical protein
MHRLVIFILTALSGAWSAAQAQDYIGYVEQLAAQAGQQARMHAQNAIMAYRQQTGDWSTPDEQVFAYLDAMARQQNPGFYADLQAREQAFQAQQQAYTGNSNAILDGMHQGYMERSEMQYQGHQDYVRGGIWDRSLYTDGASVYEMPYYEPGVVYEGYDGSTMIQDEFGQYRHYDAYGWGTEMDQYYGE